MSGNLTDGVPSAASADDLAVLTCLFSAEPHARRAANFRVFSERMGANLFTAEIAYGTMPWLTEAGPRTLHFRGGPRHVLWQKERLLNALMERLPERYRYVAWVDGDILFDRVDWMAGAVGLLERSPVIQLFDSVGYLDETGRPAGEKRGLISAAASAGADAFAIAPGPPDSPGPRGVKSSPRRACSTYFRSGAPTPTWPAPLPVFVPKRYGPWCRPCCGKPWSNGPIARSR